MAQEPPNWYEICAWMWVWIWTFSMLTCHRGISIRVFRSCEVIHQIQVVAAASTTSILPQTMDAFIFYTMRIWLAIQHYTKELSYTSHHSVFSVQYTAAGSRTELTEAQIQFVTTETNYSFCIQEGNDYTLYMIEAFLIEKINIFVCFEPWDMRPSVPSLKATIARKRFHYKHFVSPSLFRMLWYSFVGGVCSLAEATTFTLVRGFIFIRINSSTTLCMLLWANESRLNDKYFYTWIIFWVKTLNTYHRCRCRRDSGYTYNEYTGHSIQLSWIICGQRVRDWYDQCFCA